MYPRQTSGNISWRQRNVTKQNIAFDAVTEKLRGFVIYHYYFINLGIGRTLYLFTHNFVLYCCDQKYWALSTWGLPLFSHGWTSFQEVMIA